MIDSILPRTSLALAVTLTVAVFSSALAGCSDNAPTVGGADPALFVAVTQFVKQPSLDAVQRGLKDSLAEAGYVEGDTLRWEMINAKGNPVRAAQIATKYVRANPDVIVAIATPSAQAVAIATQNKNIPVIFSAVLNPVETKLVESLDKPGSTISGVSDLSPVSQDLMLIKEVLPEANTLGVIYTAGEADSAILVSRVKSQAPDQGFIEVKEVTVTDSSEVAEAARSLVGSVDAIYMVTDNTVTTALKSVIEVGQDNDLPVFADDTDAVEKGAIASIGFHYYDLGRQTGDMVAKVLKGSRPAELPVEFVNAVQLFVNPASAEEMGVTVPQSVISRADKVVE